MATTFGAAVALAGTESGVESVRLRNVVGSRLEPSGSLMGESCVPAGGKSFGEGVDGRYDCEEDLRILVPPRRGRLNLLDFSGT